MQEFEFTLKFSLTDASPEPGSLVERLGIEGCDDALIGIGKSGRIALQFNREAESAVEAVCSAMTDIKRAIPGAKLIEAMPDLVGLTDIAEVLGFSRQNIRKLMLNNSASFPTPIHEGNATLWHLSSVLTWLIQGNRYPIDDSLLDVARVNMQLNIVKETAKLDPSMPAEFISVLV